MNLQGFSKELATQCSELEAHVRTASLSPEVQRQVDQILGDGIPSALRYISASTTKFQRLIDALLQLSRSGRQEQRQEELDVHAIVDTTLDSLRQSIEKSGATVSVHLLPAAIGDSTAIGQVFANLIGNALNYLQPGRPGLIELGGEVEDGMAHYWVRDNGSGIPESAQRRLFQVFQRFHPKLAPGEGMGLAIAKRAVERNGGTIWATRNEGGGTTFHLTLPPLQAKRGEP